MKARSVQRCPECDGVIIDDGGEAVCQACGLVVGETPIDSGPQWRSRSDTEQTRRTGSPRRRDRHDRGLSTEIGHGTDAEVPPGRRRQFARMRRQHNRARLSSKVERNKVYAYSEIRRLVAAFELPESTSEQACALFDSAQSAELLQGRSLEGFTAATVYAVCKLRSISRTIDEIASKARCDRGELTNAYDALNRSLELPIGPTDPTEYIPRYATLLDVDSGVERRAREYAAQLVESGRIGGKNPSGVAAGCLYAADRDQDGDLTQTSAAEVADVSRMTIRSTVDRLESQRATQQGGLS